MTMKYVLCGTLITAIMIAGCAGPPATEQIRVFWPPEPEITRIQFLRSIASERDVGEDTTFTQKVVNLLSGQKAPQGRLTEPMGLAVSNDGQRIYASSFNLGKVFVFDFEQSKLSYLGPLILPAGVALDSDDNVYVVEQGRRQIQVFNQQGEPLREIKHPELIRPVGIAVDSGRGRVYVADTGHTLSKDDKGLGHNIEIFDLQGQHLGSIGAGPGAAEGELFFPTYLHLDQAGNLYVTDTLNSRVQVFDPAGKYLKHFGQRGNRPGMFDKPKGVALDSFGNVYIVDSGWSNIQIFNQEGQVLMFFGGRGRNPGLLQNPTAICIDKENRIYVADFLSHRINVYQLINTSADDSFVSPQAGVNQSNKVRHTQQDAVTPPPLAVR